MRVSETGFHGQEGQSCRRQDEPDLDRAQDAAQRTGLLDCRGQEESLADIAFQIGAQVTQRTP